MLSLLFFLSVAQPMQHFARQSVPFCCLISNPNRSSRSTGVSRQDQVLKPSLLPFNERLNSIACEDVTPLVSTRAVSVNPPHRSLPHDSWTAHVQLTELSLADGSAGG